MGIRGFYKPAAGLDAAIKENLKYLDFREGTIWH
jgi:hypothetical protein